MAPLLWYPQRYNLDEDLEDVAPTTDFTCTRCHYGFSPGESGAWALRTEAKGSIDWTATAPAKGKRTGSTPLRSPVIICKNVFINLYV